MPPRGFACLATWHSVWPRPASQTTFRLRSHHQLQCCTLGLHELPVSGLRRTHAVACAQRSKRPCTPSTPALPNASTLAGNGKLDATVDVSICRIDGFWGCSYKKLVACHLRHQCGRKLLAVVCCNVDAPPSVAYVKQQRVPLDSTSQHATITAQKLMQLTQLLPVSPAGCVQVSDRVWQTDPPVIVKTKRMMAGRQGVLSLAQGIVHWPPPPSSLAAASHLIVSDPTLNAYGPAEGLPALREALRHKIRHKNGLHGVSMLDVVAGENFVVDGAQIRVGWCTAQCLFVRPTCQCCNVVTNFHKCCIRWVLLTSSPPLVIVIACFRKQHQSFCCFDQHRKCTPLMVALRTQHTKCVSPLLFPLLCAAVQRNGHSRRQSGICEPSSGSMRRKRLCGTVPPLLLQSFDGIPNDRGCSPCCIWGL